MRNFKFWAASRSLDAAAAYAARGRPYRELSDARLADRGTVAFPSTVQHSARADLRALERDLSSEHKLRGREVPYEAVAEDRKLLIDQILTGYQRSLEGVACRPGQPRREAAPGPLIRTRVVHGMPAALREVAACSRSIVALRSANPPR